MEEKDYEENEINAKNNIDNSSLSLSKRKISNYSENEENEEKRQLLDLSFEKENEEKIEVGTKILCPKTNCFENCIIMVEPHFFEVYYNCMGTVHKETGKLDIIDFIKKSGKSKEKKEKCSICKKTYEVIEKNGQKLYKCYCGKNVCENCNNLHPDKEKDNENNHHLVDFKDKDYICGCNNKRKKFNSFCISCRKNLCINCSEKHMGHNGDKEHKKIQFSNLFQLSKDKKIILEKKIELQRKLINKFNEIIDDWLNRTKNIIDKYKTKLKLYHEINLSILNQYKPNKINYESIKNIEHIRTDFDENYHNLIISENNFKEQNYIICNLLNENMDKYISFPKMNNDLMEKNFEEKETITFNGYVKHLCEMKENGLLVVNICQENKNIEELRIFNQIKKNFNLELEFEFSINLDNKILSLKELKNGNLLIVNEKQFQIMDITKIKSLKTIQEENIDDNFIDIIELINGNLASISTSINNRQNNNIILWKKNLISGMYKIDKNIIISTNQKPISILEINKVQFVVFFEDNNIYIYDSKTAEGAYLSRINCQFPFNKMIKVEKDGILFIYEKELVIFSISSLQIKSIRIDFNIMDICHIYNFNNYFLASISKENKHGLMILDINLLKYKIYKIKEIYNIHPLKINCVYQLDKGNIITCSDDRTLKIWNLKE